jgi:hypothetical protein
MIIMIAITQAETKNRQHYRMPWGIPAGANNELAKCCYYCVQQQPECLRKNILCEILPQTNDIFINGKFVLVSMFQYREYFY